MTKSQTGKSTIKNDSFATVIPPAIETISPVERIVEIAAEEPKAEVVEKPRPANADRQRRTIAMVETPSEKIGSIRSRHRG